MKINRNHNFAPSARSDHDLHARQKKQLRTIGAQTDHVGLVEAEDESTRRHGAVAAVKVVQHGGAGAGQRRVGQEEVCALRSEVPDLDAEGARGASGPPSVVDSELPRRGCQSD